MISIAPRPRLVYERWTDPIAGDVLELADVDIVQLDLTARSEQNWAALTSAHGYQVATRTDTAQVAGGSQWLAGPELIERCGSLLAVCSAGAGYDVIDVEACTRAGIAVCNNSGPGAEAVAEHALGFMLDLAKKISGADRALRAGPLENRLALRGTQLLGKTLGVVGLGAIGSRLVELCAPFEMEVLVFDPYLDEATAAGRGVTRVELAELIRRSDFVQVTCPLTAETEGLIGRAEFAAMKPTAFFITTARGPIHDESALLDALRSGDIAGAGLDVFHTEPPRQDDPLLHLNNVVATPHTAGITVEAVRDIAVATATQWTSIFGGQLPPRLLNPDVWPRYCERFHEIFGFRPSADPASAEFDPEPKVTGVGYQTIDFEVRGHAACVTLNRPEVLNAINDEMIAELAEVYAEIERSQDIWTVIITGAGRALCVGADVNKAADHDIENAAGIDTQGDPVLSSMRQWDAPQEATPPWLQMTKPIICAVNGIACGAGMDLVTTADITIASDTATLMDPHVSIGVTSGREAVRLARILPLPVAMRLVLMGRHERLDAQRCYELGVFTEVVPAATLMDRAWAVAETVNANAPLAVRGSRMAVRKGLTLPIYEAELLAENYRMKVALTKDAVEGPRAFLEKRTPQWRAQ